MSEESILKEGCQDIVEFKEGCVRGVLKALILDAQFLGAARSIKKQAI
jgi:hypothetical protein